MGQKIFILDTNVLLHDPQALFAFEDNDVVISIHVIEEIDSFKKDSSELGRNAREVARSLDRLRADGQLRDGVPTQGGGRVRVALGGAPLGEEFVSQNKARALLVVGGGNAELVNER